MTTTESGVHCTPPPTTQSMRLDEITVDQRAQSRPRGIDDEYVSMYADAIRNGDTLPPLEVFRDGDTCYLSVGFHRYAAYQRAGTTDAIVIVRDGTIDDAYLRNLDSNNNHGNALKRKDRQAIVRDLLMRCPGHPDGWYADRTKMDRTNVGRIRKQLFPPALAASEDPEALFVMPEGVHCTLNAGDLFVDLANWIHDKVDQELVEVYAEQIRLGAQFPPLLVCFDGRKYRVADGVHRYYAYQRAGVFNFEAVVVQGDARMNWFLGHCANRCNNGLSIEERVNCLPRFFEYCPDESDEWYARKAGLTIKHIQRARRVQCTPR